MSYADIEYLADSILIEALVKDESMNKYAQGGIAASLAQGIKSYVLSQYDKNHPIASIVAFLGPGLLWGVSPMISIFYEIAEALGFDWRGFWAAVGEGLKEFLTALFTSGQKPSEQELSAKVNQTVDDAAAQHFEYNPNPSALEAAKRKFSFKQEMNNLMILKAVARRYEQDRTIIKKAGLVSKLARFFIPLIKWVIKTALISLGLTAGVGAVSTLIGGTPGAGAQGAGTASPEDTEAPTAPPVSIPMSSSVSPNLLAYHKNGLNTTWLERGDISEISDILMSWVLNAYPQLRTEVSQLKSSNAFMSMVNKFQSRNRMAEGLDIFTVPHPYQRKIDIVNEIVGNYLQQSGHYGTQIGQSNVPASQEGDIEYK